jgi:hypothetical protein
MRRECHRSWFVGSFDEDAVLELRADPDQRDEVGGIDGTPAVLCRLDEFERHRDPGALEIDRAEAL